MVRYPALVTSFTQAHLRGSPFCNISRDNCAIPHKKQARKSFAIQSLEVSRDMKSIAAGPLSMSFKTQGNQTFWRDIPGFCWDIPGVPEKFEKKSLCSILGPLKLRYFRKPLRGPPTHGLPRPPSNKKRNSKNPENPDYSQK